MDWDTRYRSADGYLFGVEPNAFLATEAHRIAPRSRVLAVADGEGRNGVFLAERGALVRSVEASDVAIEKAKRLAAQRHVTLKFEQADLIRWNWPVAAYDAVVAIFVQFVTEEERPAFFRHLREALRPGGLLLLEGYSVEQLDFGTGGPRDASHLYTEAMLREAFAGMRIEVLRSYDAVIREGTAHVGKSALIDLIAVQPNSSASGRNRGGAWGPVYKDADYDEIARAISKTSAEVVEYRQRFEIAAGLHRLDFASSAARLSHLATQETPVGFGQGAKTAQGPWRRRR